MAGVETEDLFGEFGEGLDESPVEGLFFFFFPFVLFVFVGVLFVCVCDCLCMGMMFTVAFSAEYGSGEYHTISCIDQLQTMVHVCFSSSLLRTDEIVH